MAKLAAADHQQAKITLSKMRGLPPPQEEPAPLWHCPLPVFLPTLHEGTRITRVCRIDQESLGSGMAAGRILHPCSKPGKGKKV